MTTEKPTDMDKLRAVHQLMFMEKMAQQGALGKLNTMKDVMDYVKEEISKLKDILKS